jgi:small-conductance mechanosensitive channel
MQKASLKFLVLVLTCLLMSQPARPQDGRSAPPQPPPAVTPAQARQALEVVQSDAKRAQLIETLQTIAKAAPPASTPPAENLGAQLLAQVSTWFGEVSGQLAAAARTMSDFPMIWRWLVHLATDSTARLTLLDTAWKLALVIACAISAEWIVRRATRRTLAAVDRYVPPRARHLDNHQPAMTSSEATSVADARELRRWHLTLAFAWQLALRLPFVLARLTLDLLPLVSFAAIGNVLLATDIGGETAPRVVILAMVNAYVICGGVLCVTAAVVSPASNQPSLFVLRDETAAYIGVWWKRIVTVTVFGVALANIALLLGLYEPAYLAVVRIVILVVHLFVVVVILQSRRRVADFIRAPGGETGALATIRNRFADIWHILAIVLNLALWAVWALQVQNGYALLLRYFLATVAVLVIARLVSIALMLALNRVFQISPDFLRQFPGLEARANRYIPALRATVSGLVAIITVFALLEVWGVDALAWFSTGRVGARLVSALATIAIAGLIALAVWEASNAAIDQHLTRLSREGRYARAARLRTFLPMLRTTLLCIISAVVALTALSELGVNIAPLLAGAGIIGIAVGFGSQKLVQDLITGLFLLLENAMQVGDTVTVSGLTGVVENLSIRTIRLRAGDGSIHIVPFSSVTSVTNTNRGIGNAAVSVNVAYKEDTDRVGAVLKEIAAEMREDPRFKPMIRGDFDLWGVDKVDASMATIAGQIECTDTGRWPVQREFYRRMKKRFQELGIEIATPSQATVVLQHLPLTKPDTAAADGPEEPARRSTAHASAR